MVKINWSELANDDLKSIHDFIKRDSKFYADNFIKKIIKRVEQLKKFPRSGRIVPEFEDKNLRELIEGNYRIVYKIFPEYIGIVRVHHSARLITKI